MEGDTQEEVPSIDTMRLPSEDGKVILVKIFSTLNLFGGSGIIRVEFDTGAISTCNPHTSDFVELKMNKSPRNIKVISKGLQIEGTGIVEYTVEENIWNKITLRVWAFYVT